MTMLGMPFEQAAFSFGWGNLADFARNLPQTSATYRALHNREGAFITPLQQAALLADLFDVVQALSYMFAKAHGGKGGKPDPYPRPWTVGGKGIGSEPIAISDFKDWYYGGD